MEPIKINQQDLARLRRRVAIETRLGKFCWFVIGACFVILLVGVNTISLPSDIELPIYILVPYVLILLLGAAAVAPIWYLSASDTVVKLAANGAAEDFWLLTERCWTTFGRYGRDKAVFRNIVRIFREGEGSRSNLSRAQTLSLCRWLYLFKGDLTDDLWNEFVSVLSKHGSRDAIFRFRLYLLNPFSDKHIEDRFAAAEAAILAIRERTRNSI